MTIGLAGLVVGLALGLGTSSIASPSRSAGHTYRLGLDDAVEVPALGGLSCLHSFSGGGRTSTVGATGVEGTPHPTYMVFMRTQRIVIADRGPNAVYAHRW
jgi:hypothetical protein